MSIEAMKMALALNAWTHFGECRATDGPIPTPAEVDAALRTAIEQAEKQEPVFSFQMQLNSPAGALTTPYPCVIGYPDFKSLFEKVGDVVTFYTSPPPRQPLSEEKILELVNFRPAPVPNDGLAWINEEAKKEWIQLVRKIEAAHGIKVEA
jgi:hypothetical protein